jgi:hypothetical protein
VHGGQQLRFFNAHYDEYGFQPIVVFDSSGRFVSAMRRPARLPSGKEAERFLRRLLRYIRANWPRTKFCCAPTLLLAADRKYRSAHARLRQDERLALLSLHRSRWPSIRRRACMPQSAGARRPSGASRLESGQSPPEGTGARR